LWLSEAPKSRKDRRDLSGEAIANLRSKRQRTVIYRNLLQVHIVPDMFMVPRRALAGRGDRNR